MPVDNRGSQQQVEYNPYMQQPQYGVYPAPPVYYHDQAVVQHVESTPLVHQQQIVQPQQPAPVPVTTHITTITPAKKARSCFCGFMTFVLVFLLTGIAITGFVLSIVNMTDNRKQLMSQYHIDGPTSYDCVTVVSYHPFSNASFAKNAPLVVTPGYGNVITENKTMTSYSQWSQYVIDNNTITAPYKQGFLVARLTNAYSILINTIAKGSSQATYDNTYNFNTRPIKRLNSVVRLNNSDDYTSRFVLSFSTVDSDVYIVYFTMASNQVTSFTTNPQKIATGNNATIIQLPSAKYTTLALMVNQTYSGVLILCNIDTTVTYTQLACTQVSTLEQNTTIYAGNNITTGSSLYYYNPKENELYYAEYNNQNLGSFYINYVATPMNFHFSKGATVIKSQESSSFVGYSTTGYYLYACAVRDKEFYYFADRCTTSIIASDLHYTNPQLQATILGSQVFFKYINSNGEAVLRVVGVVGDLNGLAFDTIAQPISLKYQYGGVPQMVVINNSTVGFMTPINNMYGTVTGTYVSTFTAKGGLKPVGITQGRNVGYVGDVQKIGVFYNRCGGFSSFARYYADNYGRLTTQKDNEIDGKNADVGVALDSYNLYLNIY